jgi:hypothetical protein
MEILGVHGMSPVAGEKHGHVVGIVAAACLAASGQQLPESWHSYFCICGRA